MKSKNITIASFLCCLIILISYSNSYSREYPFSKYDKIDVTNNAPNLVALSPTGKFLAAASDQYKKIFIFDIVKKKVVCTLPVTTKDYINVLKYSKKGDYLGVSAGEAVYLFKSARGKPRTINFRGKTVGSFDFHPNKNIIAIGLNNAEKSLVLYNTRNLKNINTIKTGSPVNNVTFSADGKFLILGLDEYDEFGFEHETVLVINTSSYKITKRFKFTDVVTAVSISDDNTYLGALGAYSAIRLWNLKNGNPVKSFEKKTENLNKDASAPVGRISPDGKYFVFTLGSGLYVLTIPEGNVVGEPKGRLAVSFSADGKYFASLQYWPKKVIYIYDVAASSTVYKSKAGISKTFTRPSNTTKKRKSEAKASYADDNEKKASVNGKYFNLLQKLNCPSDRGGYGEFYEYGYWGSNQYCGKPVKPGYWVWVAPHWYIWKGKR